MSSPVRNLLKFVLFLGLGILLIWLAVHHLDQAQRKQIDQTFRIADYRVLIPALVAGAASHLVRSLRWRLLLRPLDFNPSLFNIFCAVMTGYLANLALPRLGEITRCAVVARYEKIPVTKVIGTMIAERSVDLISLALVVTATILLQLGLVGNFFYRDILQGPKWEVLSGWKFPVVLGVSLLILFFLLRWGFSRLRHTMAWVRFRLLVIEVLDGLDSLRRMRHKTWFLIYTVLLWMLYFLMVYIGFFCLKTTSHLGIGAALSVLAFGSIGMILTQGGIGAYQLLVQRTLTLYGVGVGIAYALGWIIWLAQTLLVVVLGFISLVLLPIINRPAHGQTPAHSLEDPLSGRP
ncbi:MAG TPA: lysylphosphatidylglycerol synthase transmembrane domain-containing protein [Chitinophagaceae bacterium]|nr:lysylphosphatidylglycerol synthase transmembrane domain-containing protein [Chitinophagaceae bacterium]